MTASSGQVQRDDWDRHWDDYAEAAEQNPAQRFRRKLVFELLGLGSEPARVLDIGSGQGDFATDLLEHHPGAELLGLEMSAAGNEIARRKAPAATFLECDLTKPETPPQEWAGWATHAVCSEVLEHVDDPGALIANAIPYMAPGCRLAVTVPGGPMSAFDRHLGHRRHFSSSDLSGVLRDAGFDVELAGGAGFPFFNLYRLVVIMRGRRLVDDVNASGGSESKLAGAAMATFRALLRINPSLRRGGWQTIALARGPSPRTSSAG